jgi:murein DD-endopeptidase MepM/ murein hydrolase activator NlpD
MPPPRPKSRPRPHPLPRVLIAVAGFAALGLGWRLTSAETARATAIERAADAVPTDYVPEDSAAPATIDPLADADATPLPANRPGAPLDFLRVTSSYGMRRHPILGFSRMHQGVDFAAREGAPVLAAADGVVTAAGPDGGYGNLIRIRHAGLWGTGYAHLSGFAPGIATGAKVLRGEVIGFVGHTGLATGPHLHFEVSLGGVKVDPMTTPFGGAPASDPHAGGYAKEGLTRAAFNHTPVGPTAPPPLRLRGALAADKPAA